MRESVVRNLLANRALSLNTRDAFIGRFIFHEETHIRMAFFYYYTYFPILSFPCLFFLKFYMYLYEFCKKNKLYITRLRIFLQMRPPKAEEL